MSFNALPEVAPQQRLSIVGSFKSAPTLVKILAADLYLSGLWILGRMLSSAVWGDGDTPAGLVDDNPDLANAFACIFAGLLFGLIFFLMGKGIARGARGMWLLLLVLYVVFLPLGFISLLQAVTVSSILSLVIVAVTLMLLLTPVVRQHCTRK